MVIHKYEVEAGTNFLHLPRGAKILSFCNQRERPMLWVLVDPELETEIREIIICMTGESFKIEASSSLDFIGTALFEDGSFLLHAFERRELT